MTAGRLVMCGYSPTMKPREPSRGEAIVRGLGGLFLDQLKHALVHPSAPLTKAGQEAVTGVQEPPVVAQLMIEIRSDGSRTIARGALNDLRNGESANVHAEGRSPAELMISLASSLLTLPSTLLKSTRSTASAAERLVSERVPEDERKR
jgi:hypothetical protein